MARTPKDVTDAELAVLELLWSRDRATVRALAETLYPGGGNSETATVQKLCERLLAKGYVDRDRGVRPATFHARIGRADLIGRQLMDVANRMCAGSLAPLLTHLVEVAQLNPRDIDKLRAHVDRLDRTRQAKTHRDDAGDPGGPRDE